MKLQRKLTNKEWKEIEALGPGVRNYRGKRTLFYNGEILWDDVYYEYLIYDWEERESWEVIIVLPGVEIIPEHSFANCHIKVVIMANSVRRLENEAFISCQLLKFVKLSRNLEYIGHAAFLECRSLTSISIPPACIEIGNSAFNGCARLIMFHVPQTTELGRCVIVKTKLIEAFHFDEDELQLDDKEQVNALIKNINDEEEYALHRACSSFNPMTDIIYGIVKRQGLTSFRKENQIGITPVQYLEENPFADIDQHKLMKRYILDMIGEAV